MNWIDFLQTLYHRFPRNNDSQPRFTQVENLIQKGMGLRQTAFLFRHGKTFKPLYPEKMVNISIPTSALRHLTGRLKPWINAGRNPKGPWIGFWPVSVNQQCEACYALGTKLKKASLTADEKKVMGIIADRTAAWLLERRLWGQLEKANRQSTLGWMSAALVHEIRNPLTALNTLIQLLPQKRNDGIFLDSFQKMAQKEVGRLVGLTGGLLNFLKTDQKKLEITDLSKIIEHATHLMRPLFICKKVNLNVKNPKSIFFIGIEGQMECLLLNLLQNALTASEAGGNVEISSGLKSMPPHGSRWIKLRVKDTGKGICPEDIPMIFNPFYSPANQGTGLGLAICQKVVENHKGFLKVKSVPDKGSTFSVCLPGAAQP